MSIQGVYEHNIIEKERRKKTTKKKLPSMSNQKTSPPLDINHHKFIALFFFFKAVDIKSSNTQPASLSSVPDRAVRLQ